MGNGNAPSVQQFASLAAAINQRLWPAALKMTDQAIELLTGNGEALSRLQDRLWFILNREFRYPTVLFERRKLDVPTDSQERETILPMLNYLFCHPTAEQFAGCVDPKDLKVGFNTGLFELIEQSSVRLMLLTLSGYDDLTDRGLTYPEIIQFCRLYASTLLEGEERRATILIPLSRGGLVSVEKLPDGKLCVEMECRDQVWRPENKLLVVKVD